MSGLTNCFNANEIKAMREVSAAVVNVSGRQRMLSQRTALFSLQLVCSQNSEERKKWRSALEEAIDLMERSHNGLICGDASLQLPGHLSSMVKSMYFEPPVDLDRKIQAYIAAIKALIAADDRHLTPENPHLCYILDAASVSLLEALDAVVSQYQDESDAQQQAIARQQAELYRQSLAAAAIAQSKAEELEKALSELNNAQAQLIQSEKMSSLGQLLAGVAHELNNPISFIYGNVNHAINYVEDILNLIELYQEEYPEPSSTILEASDRIEMEFIQEDLPKALSSIKMGSERMHEIVLSLRNFSRKDEAEMKPIDLHDEMERTLLILHNRLKANGSKPEIAIVKEYGELPPIECYPCQIAQVFMNLIGNAIDALEMMNEDERVAIAKNLSSSSFVNYPSFIPSIRIRTTALDGERVAIQIADNAGGMSDEVQACLFDPFFTTKPLGKGTGLGLSISHKIVVETHGGQINCVSAPGQGTEFWIELPVKQVCRQKVLQA